MSFVALDRRFIIWTDKEPDAPTRFSLGGLSSDGMSWEQLRAHRRVVLLAEAGSGKTEELRAQAAELSTQGQFAFHAALEDVARYGLDDALAVERERLEAWRASEQPGYFFIDSVDEAKLEGIRLETSLKRLADGIRRAPRRAYIVLSGRITDWEFRADLKRFHDLLPVPADPKLPPPLSSDALLVSALRGARARGNATSAPAEASIVVLMEPFDEDRVRRFAAAKGVKDTDPFMQAIEQKDLWSLARRPLDLQWMVEYWQAHGRFGALAAMIEASLNERVQESNTQHQLKDPISLDKALPAMERVAAAMVFGRVEKIAIPDTAVALIPVTDAMRLNAILPDWNPEQLRRLLGRAVFDPSTFGHVRLHNDNEGLVRSYLAAKWLQRRRQGGAPITSILDLLFCDTYGFPLVRPSLRQTAAWLSLWDADVAHEVIAREPGLLLAEGDPGSLTEAARASLLRRIIVELAQTGERLGYLPEESLRRFSEGQLGPTVRSLWKEHAPIEGCRLLLLRIIGLGVLKDCSDIAAEAAFGAFPDDMTQVLAGRALVAIDDTKNLERYAAYVREHASELSGVVRWEALDRLFARGLSVDDFTKIVSGMDDKARSATLSLDHYGPHCLKRLTKRPDIEAFLQGIEGLIGADEGQDEEEEDRGKDWHLSLLAATALALMSRVGPNEVPTGAMEIAFRIRHAHRYRTLDEQSRELVAALTATPERRRLAFWYIAEKCAHHRLLHGKPLDSVWAMSFLGWPPGLQSSDLEWILADAASKPSIEHAQLAIDAAMEVWRATGQDSGLLQRIETLASRDPILTGVVNRFLQPRAVSAEETEHQEEMARLQSEQAEREVERQSSWTTFIEGLRQSPDQLRKLPQPTKDNIDARLYYLWELLSGMDGQSRYAIEDVRLVEPILGAELTAAFRDALIGFWRRWEPTLESQRPPDQRNVISKIDCMGLCAVSVESVANAVWPANLTLAEARLAAQFATLELNGFPSWIVKLAALWPKEVNEVLMYEVVAELNQPSSAPRAGSLQDLEYAPLEVAQTVAPALYLDLKQRNNLPSELLAQVLGILSRALSATAESFVPFLLARAQDAPDLEIAALYLATAFHQNPTAAHAVLVSQLAPLELADQSQLVQALFPRLFGDSWRDRDREMPRLPLPVIEDLLRMAFQHIRLEDDIAHEDGKLFQVGPRDSLETARGALFKLLRDTPGPATIAALRRLENNPDMPFAKNGVEQWSLERAAADSEHSPWPAGEAFALEQQFDVAPRTPTELQAVAIRRIRDIDHQLHHGDSSLGDIFKTLPDENAVQRWVAQEFVNRRGRAYTLEREPHVADEKEPDIRLQSTAAAATLPIEIKVAESWSLKELEKGLVEQLCGRYLRLENAKHGIYLLAYQNLRPIGWPTENGEIYTFTQLVSHLRSIAANLALQGTNAPLVQVCTIDVSDM